MIYIDYTDTLEYLCNMYYLDDPYEPFGDHAKFSLADYTILIFF